MAEPKINKSIKHHIVSQNRKEEKGILKNIFKTLCNKISPQQQEEAQSNEPPKTKLEASAFLSYESTLVSYDINGKAYDGLIHIEWATPYLQQQVNRHGSVKIMVMARCWVIRKKWVKDMNILLQQDNLNVVEMMN